MLKHCKFHIESRVDVTFTLIDYQKNKTCLSHI